MIKNKIALFRPKFNIKIIGKKRAFNRKDVIKLFTKQLLAIDLFKFFFEKSIGKLDSMPKCEKAIIDEKIKIF